jgi:hypothetical protein
MEARQLPFRVNTIVASPTALSNAAVDLLDGYRDEMIQSVRICIYRSTEYTTNDRSICTSTDDLAEAFGILLHCSGLQRLELMWIGQTLSGARWEQLKLSLREELAQVWKGHSHIDATDIIVSRSKTTY